MSVVAAVKVGDSLQKGLDAFFGFIPNLIAFLVILLIGWLIAKVVRTVVNKLMDSLGVDKALHDSQAGEYVEKISPDAKPSHLIGATAYWFIFLFAISAAVGALKIPALTTFIAQIQAFLPNIVAAIIIFVVAAVLAGTVAGAVAKLMGDTPTGKVVASVVPGLILAIGLFMVLNQLHIAEQIVTITYAALLGMLALAGALAFGLGGRDVASRMLGDAYDKGREKQDDVKRDMQQGKQRAERQADRAKDKADGAGNGSSSMPPRAEFQN